MATKLFVATDNQSTAFGKELWITNGTAAGTALLKNINPSGDANPVIVAVIGARTYFTATDGNPTHGVQLWVTDGTSGGTLRLDRLPDLLSADYKTIDPANLAIFGTKLLFTATDNQSTARGREIWITDGTAAGTTLLKNIAADGDSNPANFFINGTRAYFTATDGNPTHGVQLYVTDGTLAGTNRMDRLNDVLSADYRSVDPTSLTALGARVLFVATDNQSTARGRELWVSDGGASNTFLVKNINPDGDSNPANFFKIGTKAYFTANDGNPTHNTELWVTDGTTAGTIRLDRINEILPADYRAVDPSSFRALGANLLFVATDNQSTARGRELWISDGTAGGTTLIKDINPSGDANPANLVIIGAKAYFTATDGNTTHNTELWVTDGTAAGTIRLDRLPDILSADYRTVDPTSLTVLGTKLLFVATDNQGTARGRELWVTDGTAGGASLIKDINPGGDSNPANLFIVDTKAYFTATDGNATHNTEVWVTDGSAAGTIRLDRLNAVLSADYRTVDAATFTAFGTKLLFVATDNQGTAFGKELWITDGTTGGTTMLKNINPSGDSTPANLVVSGGQAFFTATDGNTTHNTELWVTDGTAAGTLRLDRLPDILSADYKLVDPVSTANTVYSIAPADAVKLGSVAGPIAYTFTVSRTGVLTASTLAYTVTGSGTVAATAADFVGNALPSGIVSFADGDVSRSITVNVAGNPVQPQNEGFTVGLSLRTGLAQLDSGSVLAVATADGTIQTSFVVPPTFAIAATNATQPEGNAGAAAFTFTVTRAGSTAAAATLTYSVAGSGANAAAANDFTGAAFPTGTVAFGIGDTTKTITVNVAGDTTFEPDEGFTVTLAGPAGTTITTPTATGLIQNDDVAGPGLGFVNSTAGTTGLINMTTIDAGGPGYLQWQYIYLGTDSLAISTSAANVFIHTGSGTDAIEVATGQNVLDGGLGSNFLTGGSGADTFFTDSRNPGVVWTTIRNFHQTGAATLWGFTAGVSSYRWEDTIQGAAGQQGATLRANIVGGNGRTGDGVDASITFTGLSVAQGKNLQIVTGVIKGTGGVADSPYLYIYNQGV